MFVLILSPVFSSLNGGVPIRNIGTISVRKVTAKSGSSTDIQSAVNAVDAAGGGEVLVPAGNFTFNIDTTHIGVSNSPCGVSIPGGVNVLGAGNNQTILYVPLTGWNSSGGASSTYYTNIMFVLNGANDKPIRISGIMFQGSVYMAPGAVDTFHGLAAISILGVKDYRIDHCNFQDFVSCAISVSGNYVHKWNLGVVDHCIFDNPYKDVFYNKTGNWPYWAYGIVVEGDYPYWAASPDEYLGRYVNNTCFIEDNSFRRCRHAIAMSASGGWAVVRHNNFTEMIVSYYGSYVDAHGGARGFEVYDNIITNSPTDARSIEGSQYYGQYLGIGINPRGGAGVIYNNTLINFIGKPAILLSNDQANSVYRLHEFWVWSNNFVNVQPQFGTAPGTFTIVEGTDYFQYAKPGYVAYIYPHPLTLG